jgi:hypothetical protein
MILPVSYWPLTQDEVFEHYERVAGAIDISICVYNNPWTTGLKGLKPAFDLLDHPVRAHPVNASPIPSRTSAHDSKTISMKISVVSLSTENELVRNVLLAVLASLAKLEREKISQRMKAGLETSAREKLRNPRLAEVAPVDREAHARWAGRAAAQLQSKLRCGGEERATVGSGGARNYGCDQTGWSGLSVGTTRRTDRRPQFAPRQVGRQATKPRNEAYLARNRKFESTPLQQRVTNELCTTSVASSGCRL